MIKMIQEIARKFNDSFFNLNMKFKDTYRIERHKYTLFKYIHMLIEISLQIDIYTYNALKGA